MNTDEIAGEGQCAVGASSMSERLFDKFLKGVDKYLVLEFVVVFSRMEYALKKAGFAKGSDARIDIKWNDFAKDIKGAFNPEKSSELQEAVKYLKELPPKQQVIVNNTSCWQYVERKPEESDLQFLVRLVRTVRNNLFHGGKQPMDPARDTELLKSCIAVLSECRKLNDTVKREFEDYK
jgi:hypothetical protein